MDRRDYLRACGIAAAGSTGIAAGCLGFGGGSSSAPPRKSQVIEAVAVDENALVVEPHSEKWVMSGRDISLQNVEFSATSALGSLSPVGSARAGKGGGRGGGRSASSAPRTSRGRYWYGADDDDDDWYENNGDKVKQVPVVLGAVGVAYIGTNSDFQEQAPGPGPLDWDEQIDNVSGAVQSTILASQGAGWYRVGSNVNVDPSSVASGENLDLGWECLDLRVQNVGAGLSITERWKVSPEITT
jgi:hypothetical protein